MKTIVCFSTAQDKLDCVKKTYAVRKIAELLNTNNNVSKDLGHFEYDNGIVKRSYLVKNDNDDSSDKPDSKIWIGFVVFPVVAVLGCAVGFVFSSSKSKKDKR